jgi:hypothetical protein
MPLPDADNVVSIDEIDDYFTTRGAWTGDRFELASTVTKRGALRRWFWSRWLMRAGWATLALLAMPPLGIALVLGVAITASVFPGWFPAWLAQMPSWPGHSSTNMTAPQIWLLLMPAILWTVALFIRHSSCAITVTQDPTANRVAFLDPIVAGGVIGRPEVLIYSDEDWPQDTLCVPLLAIPEELAPDRDPDERHLVRAAAQCLLLESAYDIPVDFGLLEFERQTKGNAKAGFRVYLTSSRHCSRRRMMPKRTSMRSALSGSAQDSCIAPTYRWRVVRRNPCSRNQCNCGFLAR